MISPLSVASTGASRPPGPSLVAYLRRQTGAAPLQETRVPEISHVL